MLPAHLKRYVVEQDYSRYTPLDQEVWRYIMRQLRDFLSQNAHPCYIDGLSKTGIETDRIPDIRRMSEKIEKFGWQAVPVSGFIPPAAFMELQAHGFLPIASDMRTIDHLAYTPAPDIVHEAAGHAPILVEPEYAAYLKSYAQVASRAIISHEDMAQYEAIRLLSDVKEDPSSTPQEIADCERQLIEVSGSISHISEAAYLGRMNWWTAEYGLIGKIDKPRLFGAGLLSSLGEARQCLKPAVKKIPLTLDCIHTSYDITEPQPQLFVTPDFGHLTDVLNQLADQMAFKRAGCFGLDKAKQARTVNTVELESGLQISGVLKDYLREGDEPVYLQFEGPSQLCRGGREINGHGQATHPQGFGAPVGMLAGEKKCLSHMGEAELRAHGITPGQTASLKFANGVEVRGEVTDFVRDDRRLLLISFRNCTVTRKGTLLFDPAWGTYDLALGSHITSVFGGPADRIAYGETSDFVAKLIPRKQWPSEMQRRHEMYAQVRALREAPSAERLLQIANTAENFPNEWLVRLDLLELARDIAPTDDLCSRLEAQLTRIASASAPNSETPSLIRDGLKLLV